MLLGIELILFVAIAAALAWYFVGHEHGQRKPITSLWMAGIFGVGAAALAGWIEILLISNHQFDTTQSVKVSLGSALAIAAIEECCKFIPFAIYIFNKKYFNEHVDGVLFFAIVGLGFGLPENLLYTTQFGAGAGLGRLFFTPVFHAATTAFVGYWLIKSKLDRKPLFYSGLALLGVIFVHAAYNMGLVSQNLGAIFVSLVITAAMTAILFTLYDRATAADQRVGLSAVGHNKFCRSCGHPNPKHELYCTHCGQRA